MRIGLAFRAFWSVLFSRAKALRVQEALSQPIGAIEDKKVELKGTEAKPASLPKPVVAKRSDALTLLASLQREARFLDLVNESLDGFSDDQIGKAARDVLRDSKKVLTRYFAIAPLSTAEEGAQVPIPQGSSALRYCIVGNSSAGKSSGTLVHPGWTATTQNLPQWTGSDEDVLVLAPSEIEVS